MLGICRTAVVAMAFLLLSATWATAQSQPQHVLPAGTAVVFVTDANLDAGRREGDAVSVHLRDALTLDGTVLAPAGARARLLIGGTDTADGKRNPAISLDRFSIGAGLLPVKANVPIVAPLSAGTEISASTLAAVDHVGDRMSIRVPFPFGLAGDQPASMYTPTPARTAAPSRTMKPGPTPLPAPTNPPPATDVAAVTPAPAPTAASSPSAAESAFLTKIMRDLPKRYPTPQAAMKAGYVRYTNEDETGAISYANTKAWNTTDPDVPAQLWYDVKGRLIGADFSVRRDPVATPAPKPERPSLFGIDPKRVITIGAHVHYVTCDKGTGKCVYGKAVGAKKYAEFGDVEHPTADGLVKVGAVKDAASVTAVFLYPAIYDVSVWIVPNPLGQFADKNPNVVPSPRAGKGEDDPM